MSNQIKKMRKSSIKKKRAINKKNQIWGGLKHRKGEKVTFCEDVEEESNTRPNSNPTDLLTLVEKDTSDNGVISPSKEANTNKDKKKKKKKFI